jgi:hypothetical protein
MTTSETTASTSTGASAGGAACLACIEENNGSGGACELAREACTSNPGCTDLAQCVEGCVGADDPACIPGCCTEHIGGAPQYGALGSCDANACGPVCSDFGLFCAP